MADIPGPEVARSSERYDQATGPLSLLLCYPRDVRYGVKCQAPTSTAAYNEQQAMLLGKEQKGGSQPGYRYGVGRMKGAAPEGNGRCQPRPGRERSGSAASRAGCLSLARQQKAYAALRDRPGPQVQEYAQSMNGDEIRRGLCIIEFVCG